ncbi:CECR1 family adenosine deaminase [Histoplasma capsulatum var. duboisii H88]|uniref:CECR1 family adenosine deaminase n=2 Tax=Ajellomyces capsulatus TaxID=5037 RepID=F0UPR6_AJEC8|nr:cat eye syndrome critical region protein [Histoplasma capsulatum H143]EGC47019.1 CECR1 family adenosine deaminase [Histoplasma capsulatum var. duboisii H88]
MDNEQEKRRRRIGNLQHIEDLTPRKINKKMVKFRWAQASFSNREESQSDKQSATGSSTSIAQSLIARYNGARDKLWKQELELAFDAGAVDQAPKIENDAASVVQAIRDEERSRYLKAGASDHFLANVDLINRGSDLMRVARELPKGAHLHCHFNTVLHPSFLVAQARHVKCMFIRSTRSLNVNDNLNDAAITFSVLQDSTEGADIFDPNYEPLAWMRYSKFLEDFPGGREQAEEWLVKKLLISLEDAHAIDQNLEEVWDLFNRRTQMMKGLFNYESAFRNYIGKAIHSFVEDNIMYAEVRPNFFDKYIVSDDGERQLDHRFDMVGCEGRGNQIRDYLPLLLQFRATCTNLGLDIPFIFHAGETLESQGPTDNNLYDAILLDSKRIGHGFAIPQHPLLMQMCRERGIALEICPISNEILHLCPSMKNHVLPILLANAVPCTINSDNPAYFNSSLSHDFYQIILHIDSITLHGCRILAEWSIEHSCMDPKQQADAFNTWEADWTAFCQWIVLEFGPKY